MLYHATMVGLSIGEKLKSVVTNLAAIPDVFRLEAEKLLERQRPKGRPSRLSSWFACDEPNLAAEYLDAEIDFPRSKIGLKGQPHLYAVEIHLYSKHPMVLVGATAVKLSQGQTDIALLLADEYWEPKQEWKFWEYISPEITILREEAWPHLTALSEALETYVRDSDNLKRFVSGLHCPNV